MNRKKSTQMLRGDGVDIAGQETVPLEPGALSGATFCAYLKQCDLDPLRVALISGVRYLTVWNIQHGNPIRERDAAFVRHGLYKLTGVVYTAPIVTRGDGEEGKSL